MKSTIAAVVEHWHAHFRQGHDLSPEELCRDCPELLSEVNTIISVTRMALQTPNSQPTPRSSIAMITQRLRPATDGSHLGMIAEYRLLRILGQGGMGVVFEAEDTRLGRNVALKVLRPEIATESEHRERFLREARCVATLQSDHIIPIYGIGEHEAMPYLVMPLLKGMTLSTHLLRKSPLTPKAIQRIARDTARGLMAAHACGLVHRDIKPANLWLETGKPFRVRILDFGIARSAVTNDHITGTGLVPGTPGYMSPEQARGEAPDPRSDLFSLGCVLYHCATGRAPFERANVMATLTALAVDAPPRPRSLNAEVSPWLDSLIMALLVKDPVHRPHSAASIVQTIENEASTTTRTVPISAQPTPRETTTIIERRGIHWSVPLTLGLMLLTVITLILGRPKHHDYPPPPAVNVNLQAPSDEWIKANRQHGEGDEKRKAPRADPAFDFPPKHAGPPLDENGRPIPKDAYRPKGNPPPPR